jgi:hypothetical protein
VVFDTMRMDALFLVDRNARDQPRVFFVLSQGQRVLSQRCTSRESTPIQTRRPEQQKTAHDLSNVLDELHAGKKSSSARASAPRAIQLRFTSTTTCTICTSSVFYRTNQATARLRRSVHRSEK